MADFELRTGGIERNNSPKTQSEGLAANPDGTRHMQANLAERGVLTRAKQDALRYSPQATATDAYLHGQNVQAALVRQDRFDIQNKPPINVGAEAFQKGAPIEKTILDANLQKQRLDGMKRG
jgi:hypothetical protein